MADLSEGSKLCTNCQQKINLANFLIHESFCLRNIVPCENCKKPINKNQKDEHFQEFHAKVKCECGELIEKINLETHKQETCRKRQGSCFYCDLSLDFDKLEDHIEFCGSRTEKCSKCNQYVKAKDQNKHDSTKCAYPPQPVQTLQKQQPSQANLLRYQSNQATSYNSNVPTYMNENLLQRAHSLETRSYERAVSDDQVSLSLLPCEFCSEFYLSGELIDHQNSCLLNPILSEDANDPIDIHLNGLLNRNLNMNEPAQLLRTLNNPLNRDMFQMLGLNTNPSNANRNQNPLENETYMDYMTDDEDEINEIEDAIPANSIATSHSTKKNHNDINSNKIPCELCDELVEFEDWEVHQLTCKYSADVLEASRPVLNPLLAQYDPNNSTNQNIKPEIKSYQNPSKDSEASSSRGILKNAKQLPFAKEAAASVSTLKPALKPNGTTNNATNGTTKELGSIKTFNPATRPAGSKLFENNKPKSSFTSVSSNSSKTSTDSKPGPSKLNGFQNKK